MDKMKTLANNGNQPLDVDQYQEYIAKLYERINKERDFSDLYGYLHRNIGFLGKSLESNTVDEAKFILPVSWLFSLATNIGINVKEALVKKFPGICPYCLESRCVCYRTKKRPSNKQMTSLDIENEIFYKWEELKKHNLSNFSLDRAVEFISKIYPNNEVVWISDGYEKHILKLHQEMTEIHEAYGNHKKGAKPISAVTEEIADVFAWLLSAWSITYPQTSGDKMVSLDKCFVDYYRNDCPVCKKAPCECGPSDSRAALLPDLSNIDILINNLEELSRFFPEYKDSFSSLLRTLGNQKNIQSMPVVSAAMREAKALLEEIRKTITTRELNGINITSLSTSLRIINSSLKHEKGYIKSGKDYDVFLSYATENRIQALEIYEYLENNNIKTFMAEKRITPASNWEDVIKDALRSSKVFCIVASPKSLSSDWVKTETHSAWILDLPMLPVLYQISVELLPDILKRSQCIDFSDYKKIAGVVTDIPSDKKFIFQNS